MEGEEIVAVPFPFYSANSQYRICSDASFVLWVPVLNPAEQLPFLK